MMLLRFLMIVVFGNGLAFMIISTLDESALGIVLKVLIAITTAVLDGLCLYIIYPQVFR